jgi:hypothetical protein
VSLAVHSNFEGSVIIVATIVTDRHGSVRPPLSR